MYPRKRHNHIPEHSLGRNVTYLPQGRSLLLLLLKGSPGQQEENKITLFYTPWVVAEKINKRPGEDNDATYVAEIHDVSHAMVMALFLQKFPFKAYVPFFVAVLEWRIQLLPRPFFIPLVRLSSRNHELQHNSSTHLTFDFPGDSFQT